MYNQHSSKILRLNYHNNRSNITIIKFFEKYKMKKAKIKCQDFSVFKLLRP